MLHIIRFIALTLSASLAWSQSGPAPKQACADLRSLTGYEFTVATATLIPVAAEAARDLEFPVVVKPNIGGSGAGIVRFDSLDQLAATPLDLGIDGTALVQEFLPARGGSIVRVEVLDGEFFCAIRIFPDFTSFNLCPADICQTDYGVCAAEAPKKRLRIERADPPPEAIEAALHLAQAAGLDIGGLEYLVNDRNDEICFYDINALSNFVTDAVNVVGFDPTARFVDYLERRITKSTVV